VFDIPYDALGKSNSSYEEFVGYSVYCEEFVGYLVYFGALVGAKETVLSFTT
jgi:hypothetical protein